MLAQSGARYNVEGAEKLDFLVWLADQVKGSIEERRRMNLTISDLSAFLHTEGIVQEDSSEFDARGVIKGLLALRRRELHRLSYGSEKTHALEDKDARFELVLALIPTQEVNRCFRACVKPARTEPTFDSETLPGQIVSPRLGQCRKLDHPLRDERSSPQARHENSMGLERTSLSSSTQGERTSGIQQVQAPPIRCYTHHVFPPGVPAPPSFPPPLHCSPTPPTSPPPRSASCALM